jgi:hypothetical protein
VTFLSVLGLGASVTAAGGAEGALYLVCALLAAASGIAIAMRKPRLAAVPGVLLLGLIAVGMLAWPPNADLALFIACLIVLLQAGPELARRVGDSFALAAEGSSSLEVLVRKELSRARRGERPLTVVSLRLEGIPRRQELAEIAVSLQAKLRETDLIAYARGRRFYILFAETSRSEADAAWARLQEALSPAIAQRLVVGFAAFPDDNPTWEGLRELAQAREQAATIELTPGRPDGAAVQQPEESLA